MMPQYTSPTTSQLEIIQPHIPKNCTFTLNQQNN